MYYDGKLYGSERDFKDVGDEIKIGDYTLYQLLSDIDLRNDIRVGICDVKSYSDKNVEFNVRSNILSIVVKDIAFRDTVFNNYNFQFITFSNCKFIGCKFINCRLHITFNSCLIKKCLFSSDDMMNSCMRECVVQDSYFEFINAKWAMIVNCAFYYNTITRSLFDNAHIVHDNNISDINILSDQDADWEKYRVKYTYPFYENDITDCNFRRADIDFNIFYATINHLQSLIDDENKNNTPILSTDTSNILQDFRTNESLSNSIYIPMCCPSEGSFIGWKKVRLTKTILDHKFSYEFCDPADVPLREDFDKLIGDLPKYYLVKLLIPEDAKRSSSTTAKCRCSKAKVLGIYELDGSETKLKSIYTYHSLDNETKYTVGEMVYPDEFDENRWEECSSGIHFFVDINAARYYKLY